MYERLTLQEAFDEAEAQCPDGFTTSRVYRVEDEWIAVYRGEKVYDIRKGKMVTPVRRVTIGLVFFA